MGYVTLAVLILTVAALLFGALFGMMRGGNRAILRLGLVLLSIVLAIVLRGAFVDTIMNINVGEQTLKESLVAAFESGDTQLPETICNLIFALVEILIGLVLYFALFIVLRLLTWMIFFPILKIFVRAGENKRKGLGAAIGALQGVIVAFALCAPITGLVVQLDKLSNVKVDGERLVELPEDFGAGEYANSALGKVYGSAGGWYFEMLASTTGDNGQKYTINDTCDIVVTFMGLADTVTELNESMEIMSSEESTAQQQVEALKNVGNKLVEIDKSVDALSDDSKKLVNEVMREVKDLIVGDDAGDTSDLDAVFADLDVEKLKLDTAGAAMTGIATYIEKTSDEFDNNQPVTQGDVNDIVYGLADNFFIVELLAGDGEVVQIIELSEENESRFVAAINNTSLSRDDKNTLRKVFGLPTV